MSVSHIDTHLKAGGIVRKLLFSHKNVVSEVIFQEDVSYLVVNGFVFVEVFSEKKIYLFNDSGSKLKEIPIDKKLGYSYRGMKKNHLSSSGVAVLFFPEDNSLGNQWNDIEQYEIDLAQGAIGKYLGVYR